MATGVVTWSQTAASNATADLAGGNVNWQEGQAPSAVNDSGRAMMASTAKWRDDITGVLVTAGSGTAFTLATNQVFASNAAGYTVQFVAGLTNTGAVTLAVDGNTAKPLRFLTGIDLPSGVLISGSLYQATFRTASDEWLLHSTPLAAPFIVPLGGIIDYTGSSAPSSNFALPQGQAISRTTYATLFSLISTTYGVGDNSTTFNIPDLVGRVTAMRDAGSARISATYFGGNPANLGAVGGLESELIGQANLPSVNFALSGITVGVTVTAGGVGANAVTTGSAPGSFTGGGGVPAYGTAAYSAVSATAAASGGVAASGGSGTRLTTVQPTMVLNKIMRIL